MIYTDRPLALPAQLNRRSSLVMLFALVAASLVGLLAWGPVELTRHSHGFADQRAWLGVPNAFNVLSHLLLIPFGLWGWQRVARLPAGEPLRLVWALFFTAQLLATLGGMAYHWAPSDQRYVWDQLPKSMACTFMACAFLAERINLSWASPPALLAASTANVLAGLWWIGTLGVHGSGDLRPLLWLEFMPTLLVATGAWNLTGRLLRRQDWQRALISFVLAQGVDWCDQTIWAASGWVSGHCLRHVALASCVGWLAYRLGRDLSPAQPAATAELVPRPQHRGSKARVQPLSLRA